MLKQIGSKAFSGLRKVFKTEDSRFLMSVGLKVSGISFGINVFLYYFLYQVMRLNHAFFSAHGFPQFGEDSPFYDYILQESLENLYVLLFFHITLYFIGVYVGWLILRPFRTIAEYCEEVISNQNAIYKVEEFSNYNLLTRFSELFFEILRDSREKGKVIIHSIPPQFSRIHKPVQDKIFMLHFGLLLIIIGISSAVFTVQNSSAIFLNMVELATKTLDNDKAMHKYFLEQTFILDELVYMTLAMVLVFYVMLGFHLYSKVSGAAFGIFSTMRSFMKGNYSSRVHLVGYAYIRDYTRKLNKYLDYIDNNLVKEKSNG
jgi:hypothetical protein